MVLLWLTTGAALVVALAALGRAHRLAQRYEQLSQMYWELRYQYSELRTLTEKGDSATPAPPQNVTRLDGFVPLAMLKK